VSNRYCEVRLSSFVQCKEAYITHKVLPRFTTITHSREGKDKHNSTWATRRVMQMCQREVECCEKLLLKYSSCQDRVCV
jgi:hypothetical protein